MNRRQVAPRREWRKWGIYPPTHQLTGYESPQRRRYLRELAEQEQSEGLHQASPA